MRVLLPLHLIQAVTVLAGIAPTDLISPTSAVPPALELSSTPTDHGCTPLDIWAVLRSHLQCPTDDVEQMAEINSANTSTPEAPGAPADPKMPDVAGSTAPTLEPDEHFESFEEWKRRKEAEDDARDPAPFTKDPPVPDTAPRVNDNSSEDVPALDTAAGAQAANATNHTNGPAQGSQDTASSSPGTGSAAPPPPQVPIRAAHRYNYASPDCSARVLASSPQTQHASSLLHKSRDRYMLTPCRADQHWVVIELCDEIRIESVELAVWEFFSGVVRSVRVSVGEDASPAGEWKQVGEFVGKNVRGIQEFALPEPTSFHRFLRLDFPTFYGSEYYCPVSQLKVFGMNQMEAFKMEQRRAAEASGAKDMEKARERERVREAEMEREAEKMREADMAREQREREDDERQQQELCELEKLVHEQARRLGRENEKPFEPKVECAPVNVARPMATAEDYSTTEAPQITTEGAAANASPAPSAIQSQGSNPSIGSPNVVNPNSNANVPHAGPRTDSSESIYAFIIRRLNALEGNSTLVARYIDEQAKALRSAIARSEKRFEASRSAVDADLAGRWDIERMRQEERFGRIFSQLESLRVTHDAERRQSAAQFRALTDELWFERQRSLAQLVILVVVVVLGLLSRGTTIERLLRPLASEALKRSRSQTGTRSAALRNGHTRGTPSSTSRKLSTGPLAGLVIDIPGDDDTPMPSAGPRSPTFRGGLKPRRPSTPTGVTRRRTPGSRSFSAMDPAAALRLLDDDTGDLGASLLPPSPTTMYSSQSPHPRSRTTLLPPSASRARRLARSAHLHPLRRRADDDSEAERERDVVVAAVVAPAVMLPSGTMPRHRAFTTSTNPDDDSAWTEDGSMSASASEVEDEVAWRRAGNVRFDESLAERFWRLKQVDEETEKNRSPVRSRVSPVEAAAEAQQAKPATPPPLATAAAPPVGLATPRPAQPQAIPDGGGSGGKSSNSKSTQHDDTLHAHSL